MQNPVVKIRPADPTVTVRTLNPLVEAHSALAIKGVSGIRRSDAQREQKDLNNPLVESERKAIVRQIFDTFQNGRYKDLADKCLGIQIKEVSGYGRCAVHEYWIPNGREDSFKGSAIFIAVSLDRKHPRAIATIDRAKDGKVDFTHSFNLKLQ